MDRRRSRPGREDDQPDRESPRRRAGHGSAPESDRIVFSEASVRIRGAEETIKILDDFPNRDPNNQALLTWLKIQKVIVLQEVRGEHQKDTPAYAAVTARIDEVFKELSLFEKRNLSEYALQQIGLNFSRGTNPFQALPYFEELLSRENQEAEQFKSPAEFEIAKIEMRSPEAAKVSSARERFRRIINKYEDKALTPGAHLNLAKIHIKAKEWSDALDELQVINKEKWMFRKDRAQRAEAGLLLGEAAEQTGDILGAAKAYLSVLSTYNAFPEFATEAFHRYAKISLADIQGARCERRGEADPQAGTGIGPLQDLPETHLHVAEIDTRRFADGRPRLPPTGIVDLQVGTQDRRGGREDDPLCPRNTG